MSIADTAAALREARRAASTHQSETANLAEQAEHARRRLRDATKGTRSKAP